MIWQVFAIRYAGIALPRTSCFLGVPDSGLTQPLDFFFWVVAGQGRVIVIDTGFEADVAHRRNRIAEMAPAQALAVLGVDPGTVETVILTHLHYDHAGNTGLFPKARFHLQQAELEYATGAAHNGPAAHHYAPEDLARITALIQAGRVELAQGDVAVAPGIRVILIPGHTAGQQVVQVMTADGPLVIASDAAHFYAGLRDGKPFPVNSDLAAKHAGYARIRELAAGSDRIVAGHDPEVLRLFPDRAGHPFIARIRGNPALPLVAALPNFKTEGPQI